MPRGYYVKDVFTKIFSQEASCPEIVISENSPSPPVSESPTTKALGFEMVYNLNLFIYKFCNI